MSIFSTIAHADTKKGWKKWRVEEREHRGAIGAESKVMERTCRATKKDGDGKEKSYKPPKACRENKIRAGESEAESARIHVPVRF